METWVGIVAAVVFVGVTAGVVYGLPTATMTTKRPFVLEA